MRASVKEARCFVVGTLEAKESLEAVAFVLTSFTDSKVNQLEQRPFGQLKVANLRQE